MGNWKTYGFSLHKTEDKELDEILKALPANERSKYIRAWLRFALQHQEQIEIPADNDGIRQQLREIRQLVLTMFQQLQQGPLVLMGPNQEITAPTEVQTVKVDQGMIDFLMNTTFTDE